MVCRAYRNPSFVFLLLGLLVSPAAALAAAENAVPEEHQSQSEPESKSYLPPWMQERQSGEAKTGTTANTNGAAVEIPAAGADAEADKKKAQVTSPDKKEQRRSRRQKAGFSLRGLVGLFGR